ncbi:hypothetical protein BGX28_010505, partial [Mortierella sp. GBA30]
MPLILSDAEMAWIQGESVRSPDAYLDKQRGHLRYARLLQTANLSDRLRKQLLDRFNIWKTDKAPQFWLNRRARLAAMRTVATLIEGSKPYAEEAILHNVATVSRPSDMHDSSIAVAESAATTSQADVNLIDEVNEDYE